MEQQLLTDWGTFFSGVGTLVIAIGGLMLVLYDIRLRRSQLRETRARAHATLNVELLTRIIRQPAHASAAEQLILETRILVTNASSEVWAIPAVYIHARAIPTLDNDAPMRPFSEVDFSDLPKCGLLSQPLNVAAFPDSIFFVAPGETDGVVRWDVLPDNFVRDVPAVVVRAEVFSVLDDIIGASYSSERFASPRNRWLKFMQENGGARNHRVIFTVIKNARKPGSKKGEWALLQFDNNKIDWDATHEFRDILDHTSKAGRQALVLLRGPEADTGPIRPV